MNRFVFGPVPSRRLGQSLGIDLTPTKTCTLDCRYCQLSRTIHHTASRGLFCDPAEVLAELRHVLGEIAAPDWITFSGTGEPTLHAGLGIILAEIKKLGVAPTCVITNSSLLGRSDVRADLCLTDRLLPTLCTVVPATFERLHRPAPGLHLPDILDGLRLLSGAFKGIIDLEVFVCPGINDGAAEIDGLREYIRSLPRLDSIYLNTAVRQPLERDIVAASPEELLAFRDALGLDLPVATAFEHTPLPRRVDRKPPPPRQGILDLLLRHPCTVDQLERVLNLPGGILLETLQTLEREGKVHVCPDGQWRLT
ncbi:MAG: radical SAM protein [Candidatus Riflebacteria bacterium]|nr:radical SAM protein [Candidatus Riflebacteria bacterium]